MKKNYKFAEPIKEILLDIFKISNEELESWKDNVIINDKLIRTLLLNLGSGVIRNSLINDYLEEKINKEEFQKIFLERFLPNEIEAEQYLIKDKNKKKKISSFSKEEFKNLSLNAIENFIKKYKKNILSETNTLIDILILELKSNNDKKTKLFISDARFENEIEAIIQKFKKDVVVILPILIRKDKNNKYITKIKNKEGQEIDTSLLLSQFSQSTNLKQFEKFLLSLNISKTEILSSIYTIYYFYKNIYTMKQNLLLKEIEEEKIFKDIIFLPSEKNAKIKDISDILPLINQKNIVIMLGASENGKDHFTNILQEYYKKKNKKINNIPNNNIKRAFIS